MCGGGRVCVEGDGYVGRLRGGCGVGRWCGLRKGIMW